MSNPISLCMIVRDDPEKLEKCLETIRPYVAEINIIDTGSKDARVLSIVKKYADNWKKTYEFLDSKGRMKNFAKARQASFDMASQKFLMWLDSDDVYLKPELLNNLNYDSLFENNIVISLQYLYTWEKNGDCNQILWKERIFPNKGTIRWTRPVHEFIECSYNPTVFHDEYMMVLHDSMDKDWDEKTRRDFFITRRSYLDGVEEDIHPLTELYLFEQLWKQGKHDLAIWMAKKAFFTSRFSEKMYGYLARQVIGYYYEYTSKRVEPTYEKTPDQILFWFRILKEELPQVYYYFRTLFSSDKKERIHFIHRGLEESSDKRKNVIINPLFAKHLQQMLEAETS